MFFLLFMGLIPWLLAVFFTRRTATLSVPVYEGHPKGNPWVLRIVLAGVAIASSVAAIGYALQKSDDALGTRLLAGAVCGVVGTLLVALFVADRRIPASAIDHRTVTRVGACKEFVQALENGRRGSRSGGGARELPTAKYLRTH